MIIQVNNLSKTYQGNSLFQVQALNQIFFSIDRGEIVGLIGASGSGKSTLFKCLVGIIQPTSGEIVKDFVAGEKIGLLLQEPELQFFLETVYDEIAFGVKNKSFSEMEIKEKIDLVLTKVNYLGDLIKSPFRLSGGEKKKVALASILVTEPVFLLLDEPTIGLDNSGNQMLYNIINEYRQQSRSIVIISHDLDFLYQVVDRFILLESGSLVADFTSEEIPEYADKLIESGVGIPEKVALLRRNPPSFLKEIL